MGADPQKNEHLKRKPPSTYTVTEYLATCLGGNAGTIQFLSAFSPSSILASAYWALHRPSREPKRYHSLWSSVFPVPSARRGITSCSRLRPNTRRQSSSLQPHHVVYLAMAVAAAVRDRRCGVFRHQPWVELFVTVADFARVRRAMFWFSSSLRPTVAAEATYNRQDFAASCYVRHCGVTCHCCCEADCCGSGKFRLLTSEPISGRDGDLSRHAHSNVRYDIGPLCACRFPLSRCTVQVCSYQRAESSQTVASFPGSFFVVHVRCTHSPERSVPIDVKKSSLRFQSFGTSTFSDEFQ